jgi:hypothetical protein
MSESSYADQQKKLFLIYNIDRHIENLTYMLQEPNRLDYNQLKEEVETLTFTLAEKKCDYESKYNETLHLSAFAD